MCEIKNTIDEIKGRLYIAKEKINELEIRTMETNQNKAQKEKQNKKENKSSPTTFSNLIYVYLESLKKKGNRGNVSLFKEIMSKSISNLIKIITLQIQELEETPSTRKIEKTTPQHAIINLPVMKKNRILKAARKKDTEGKKVNITSDFLQKQCKQENSEVTSLNY